MGSNGWLGDYLRARRDLVRPEDAGIGPDGHRRRVRGLRREEVAARAGISTEYYLRLEQGRETRPSKQVLDALARALLLDDVAAAYLHELARPRTVAVPQPGDTVHESVQWLIDSWPMTAAVVHNRYIDVLASNSLARALSANYTVGVNNLFSLLMDPADREFHEDWESLSARSVALLRSMVGRRKDDERLGGLVDSLTARSETFRRLWERNDVIEVSSGVHAVRHPRVGDLTLHFARLPLVGTDGHSIFLYNAEPGSPTADRLASLAEARR